MTYTVLFGSFNHLALGLADVDTATITDADIANAIAASAYADFSGTLTAVSTLNPDGSISGTLTATPSSAVPTIIPTTLQFVGYNVILYNV